MIRFRDGKPTGIYFSQHSDGEAFEWDDAALAKEDERVSLRRPVYPTQRDVKSEITF